MRVPRQMVAAMLATGALVAAATQAPAATARPRTGAGSAAIAFTREDTVTVDQGDPFAPPGRTPIVGDFLGDATATGILDDIFWYTPGAGGDALWRTRGDRSWASTNVSVSGSYTPLVGWFGTDDDKQDIFWYAPGSGQDVLWDFKLDGSIVKTNLSVNGAYTPVVGPFTEDGADDIIWYGPGRAPDSWWDFSGSSSTPKIRSLRVDGTYTPVVQDFAGIGSPTFDYATDIIWYAPGSTPDSLWDFNGDGGIIIKHPLSIDGTYTPIPGNFSADGFDDVIWYAPGTAPDYRWDFTNAVGGHTVSPMTIDGTYKPIPQELFQTEQSETDILWFGPGNAPDLIWNFTSGPAISSVAVTLTGDRTPVLGTFERHPFSYSGGGQGTGADIIDLHT